MVRKQTAPKPYRQKTAPIDAKNVDRRRAAILRAADGHAVVTHTTAIVAAVAEVDIRVISAQTDYAEVHTNFGPFFLIFRNAAAVHGFISGFASARPLLSEVEVQVTAPAADTAHDFALATLAVVYLESPDYRVTRVSRWSEVQRRKIYWIELVMGPVTWRIIEHVAYDKLMEQFGRLHAVSTGAFLDGQHYLDDPTTPRDAFDRTRRRPRPAAAAPTAPPN